MKDEAEQQHTRADHDQARAKVASGEERSVADGTRDVKSSEKAEDRETETDEGESGSDHSHQSAVGSDARALKCETGPAHRQFGTRSDVA